jgi:hypothetical protein
MELSPTHFGLSVDPRPVSPGGTIALRYHLINHGGVPAAPASVAFRFDTERIAEYPDAVDIGILAPGEAREICASARLDGTFANEATIRVQAALTVGDAAPLGSNIAVVTVRGRAELATATQIALRALTADAYAIDVHVCNAGDGTDPDARLVIDLPAGLCAADGAPRLEAPLPPLQAGAAADLVFAVRRAGLPVLPLRIADAAIVASDGQRVALAPSDPVQPPAAPPRTHLHLERHGRRVDVRVSLENPSDTVLEQAAIEFRWPRAFRFGEGSMLVDGRAPLRAGTRAAAATLKTSPGGAIVTVARMAERSAGEICFSGYAPPGTVDEIACELRSGSSTHAARAVFPPGSVRPPALALRGAIAPTAAGGEAAAEVLLIGGDESCTLTLGAGDAAARIFLDDAAAPETAPVTVAAGCVRALRVVYPVAASSADGSLLPCTLLARTERGDAIRLDLAFPVRSRAWLDVAGWLMTGADGAQLSIVNRGSTPAYDVAVRADDGTVRELGTIAPGEGALAAIDADARAAFALGATLRAAGVPERRLPAVRERTHEAANIVLEGPPAAHAGVAFPVRWSIALPEGAYRLDVRIVEDSMLGAVAGTTTIDGHAVVDDAGARIATGLTLHAVPAGATIRFGTQCIARSSGTATVAIATRLDGGAESLMRVTVAVAARSAFPQRPGTLRFYLEGDAVGPAAPDEPREPRALAAPPAPPPPTGLEALRFALQRAGDDPIADALGVLSAMMPGGDARDAFRENAERLAVKLRIPGYYADPDDYESPSAREALDRARASAGIGPLATPRGSAAALAVWCATIDPALTPALPVAAYVRAFLTFIDEGETAGTSALCAARDALRAACAGPGIRV